LTLWTPGQPRAFEIQGIKVGQFINIFSIWPKKKYFDKLVIFLILYSLLSPKLQWDALCMPPHLPLSSAHTICHSSPNVMSTRHFWHKSPIQVPENGVPNSKQAKLSMFF
jgi:hypothetical protein